MKIAIMRIASMRIAVQPNFNQQPKGLYCMAANAVNFTEAYYFQKKYLFKGVH